MAREAIAVPTTSSARLEVGQSRRKARGLRDRQASHRTAKLLDLLDTLAEEVPEELAAEIRAFLAG